MLLFLPENLYRKNKDLINEYQKQANDLISEEKSYKELVSYVSEGINSENYEKMQSIFLKLYDKLNEVCVDQDKIQLYICFNENMAKNELKNCATPESMLYCLYVIITNNNGQDDKYINKFESVYISLPNEQKNELSERIILAHYLNLMRSKWNKIKTYNEVYDYIKQLIDNVPEKFKTEYFYNILKHHIIQYLPGLMSRAIETSYKGKIINQQKTVEIYKKFVKDVIDLLSYEDYEYSFHYLNLCVLLDSVLGDLTNYSETFNLVNDYTTHFKNDQRRAFFASKSHNYDPYELLSFVEENKKFVPELYRLIYE